MYATQLNAYKTAQKTAMSGREIEAEALTNTALRIAECQKRWDEPGRNDMLKEALRINQILWSIFQTELAKEENPLPRGLKQDILALSVFVDRRMMDILAFPAPEKLTVLININLNMAAGLKGTAETT